MRRREFITLLGGAAATWPVVARGQQSERMRRIGVLMPGAAADSEYQARNAAFLQGLAELGWIVGRNVRLEYRWGGGEVDRYRALAAELLALSPDVVLAMGGPAVGALQRVSRTVPIVFANVTDPVGGGFVASLARPESNATGFSQAEYGFGGKWLELLKELAPHVTHVAVMRDPSVPTQVGLLGSIQSAAPSFGVEIRPIEFGHTAEMERNIGAFASKPNGGLIVVTGAQGVLHRELIVMLAAQHGLPAIYGYRNHAETGGLISYGIDNVEQFRRAAGYIDRILKGEKPADLPVQAPTKFELVINLKTAKALGLVVPPALLSRADEVIE